MKAKTSKARRPLAVRILLALLLLPLALFCAFGFLATFEPNEPAVTWTFRALYGGFGLASLLGMIHLLRPSRSRLQSRNEPLA